MYGYLCFCAGMAGIYVCCKPDNGSGKIHFAGRAAEFRRNAEYGLGRYDGNMYNDSDPCSDIVYSGSKLLCGQSGGLGKRIIKERM